MSPGLAADDDAEAIEALLDAVAAAHRDRDAAALARCYAPGATLADLAPPLVRRGFDRAAAQAWFDGWDGPVAIETRDLAVETAGDLALVTRLQLTRAPKAGAEQRWWSRATLALARTASGWRIAHEHTSVPFHMDGSARAALDLEP